MTDQDRQLSETEETMLRRADGALQLLITHYQDKAFCQLQDIIRLAFQQDWDEASRIAHAMGGEAGFFDKTHAGKAAMLLRDFLLCPAPGNHLDAIQVGQESVGLLIHDEVGLAEAERLVSRLEDVARTLPGEMMT